MLPPIDGQARQEDDRNGMARQALPDPVGGLLTLDAGSGERVVPDDATAPVHDVDPGAARPMAREGVSPQPLRELRLPAVEGRRIVPGLERPDGRERRHALSERARLPQKATQTRLLRTIAVRSNRCTHFLGHS